MLYFFTTLAIGIFLHSMCIACWSSPHCAQSRRPSPVLQNHLAEIRNVTSSASVQAFIPPSTVRFAPVMYEDSGPAMNATAAADAAGGAGDESRFPESVLITWVPDDWTLTPGAVFAVAESAKFPFLNDGGERQPFGGLQIRFVALQFRCEELVGF